MEALKKLAEMVEYFQIGLTSLNKLVKENQDESSRLDLRGSELAKTADDLSRREGKIGPAEAVMATKGQAVADRAESENLLKKAKLEAEKITADSKAKLEALDVTEKKIVIDFEKCKNEMAMIQKEWIGLKKEQETWKANFIEELKNKVK